MELTVRVTRDGGPGRAPLEVVERKGLGHPDTICDAIAERVCATLCAYYTREFGTIAHHNVDKVLLCAGSTIPALGGGKITAPMEIVLGGRATDVVDGRRVPVADLAVSAARAWVSEHLRIDPKRDVIFSPRIRGGSTDLTSLFARGGTMPLANDTSIATGFSPLTDTERVVLAAERALRSERVRAQHPAIGEDVKLLALRRGDRITLMVACAMVDRHVGSLAEYVRERDAARAIVIDAARAETSLGVDAVLNAGDDVGRGQVYLTVTGTSAEAGDDGEVGRGNRASGLITPHRMMSLEAVAGKNPVTHTGKLYALAAERAAHDIASELPSVLDVQCLLVSRIGRPIDDPIVAEVRVALDAGASDGDALDRRAREALSRSLADLPRLREQLMAGTISVC